MSEKEINQENEEEEEAVKEKKRKEAEKKKKDEAFIKKIAVIGGVALGTAIAAPIAITAVVGALGFGAGGIAAGSFAAWAMSLGGGVTPAAVAVCQSIGATGAIAASTQVAAGAVGAAAAAASKKK